MAYKEYCGKNIENPLRMKRRPPQNTYIDFKVEDSDSDSTDDYAGNSNIYTRIYQPYSDAKFIYILFIQQLISIYAELKKASMKLNYLYRLVFREGKFGPIQLLSDDFHRGLFLEIVINNPDIAVKYT